MALNVMFVVPSLMRAGAETQVVDLVNQVDPARVRAHLFTFERQLDQLARLDTSRVTHHQCLRRGKFDLEPARALGRLIDTLEIDVLHCTLQFALLMGWLARRYSRRQPRLIVAVHTTINRNLKGELQDRLLYQWLMRRCDRIIFVCEAQRQHWVQRYAFIAGRGVTAHNGIAIGRFEPEPARLEGRALRARLGIAEDALVIAHVAAFRPEKAHGIVLQALLRLVQSVPNVAVIFAGDGLLRAEITRQGQELGLGPRLHFIGNVSDVRPVLGAADWSVLPSTAVETFSLAMLESLALEVPMIASDLGGAREAVLPDRTGLLVAAGDVAALAGAMARLAGDPALRRDMGRAGRQLVLQHYTGAQMAAKTQEIIAASLA